MEYVVFEDMMNNYKMKVYCIACGGRIRIEYYILNSVLVYNEYHTRPGEYRSYSHPSTNTLLTLWNHILNPGALTYELIPSEKHCSKRCI